MLTSKSLFRKQQCHKLLPVAQLQPAPPAPHHWRCSLIFLLAHATLLLAPTCEEERLRIYTLRSDMLKGNYATKDENGLLENEGVSINSLK